jgi:hypothetical protein
MGSISKKELAFILRLFFKSIKPWRENPGRPALQDDYQKGWNACIKEVEKRANKYLTEIDNL